MTFQTLVDKYFEWGVLHNKILSTQVCNIFLKKYKYLILSLACHKKPDEYLIVFIKQCPYCLYFIMYCTRHASNIYESVQYSRNAPIYSLLVAWVRCKMIYAMRIVSNIMIRSGTQIIRMRVLFLIGQRVFICYQSYDSTLNDILEA